MNFDVCVVGSANLDIVARVARLPGPGETVLGSDIAEHAGGKGLNQAVAASRSGARTCFVGALGADDAGRALRAVLDAEQIAAQVAIPDRPTGRALIGVDEHGENSIIVVPGANAAVDAEVVLPAASVVLLQLEIPIEVVESVSRRAAGAGSTLVLNPAPAASLSPDLLRRFDVVVPNEHEARLLGGHAAMLAAGCRAVVTTRGARGAVIHTADGDREIPSIAVDPIDTTGAGDAFCGSLAARLAAGEELVDAVRWAVVAGALATTVAGAVPAQPSAAAIRSRLG